jgi:hypothetical protein
MSIAVGGGWLIPSGEGVLYEQVFGYDLNPQRGTGA